MQFIMNLLELGEKVLNLLFAIPILGILLLAGTFGPIIAKAIAHR